jgi:hypothetical protein
MIGERRAEKIVAWRFVMVFLDRAMDWVVEVKHNADIRDAGFNGDVDIRGGVEQHCLVE